MTEFHELNRRINSEWGRLHKPEDHQSSQGHDGDQGFSENEEFEEVKFDLSEDIPKICHIIGDRDNKEELIKEIKEMAMRYYWIGFYDGVRFKETEN